MASTKERRLPAFKILLFFVCVALMAVFLVPRLPVKLASNRSMPSLTLSFSMRNSTARVVEMTVTSKLEAMLSRVEGVKNVNSSSGNGWGSITIELNKHVDIEEARFEVATMIHQVYPSLPSEVSYPSLSAQRSDDNAVRPFMTFTLNAPSSPLLFEQYAEQVIKRQLDGLKGIDKVDISGATGMVWQLEYDYEQLKQLELTVGDIQTAIQHYLQRENLGMGLFETGGGTNRWIRLALTPTQLPAHFEASKVVVKNQHGKLIRLDELVDVSYIEETPSSYYRINGLNSIYLSITPREDANQLKLAREVTRTLVAVASHFPPNFEMHLSYDATEYIRDQLKTILLRSGLTILILLLFVLLIYRNNQYLLMITASMLGSFSLAVVLYYLLGMEMHLYSLMGITISMSLMLDNIIVMADQIHRQKNRKAFLAILTATLTTMAALVMIFFMDEKVRLNLQDFALVIMINLGVSLVVVLWLVPALMNRMQIDRFEKHQSMSRLRRKVRFNRGYMYVVSILSRRRWWVFVLGVLIFGLPIFLLPATLETKEKETGSESVEPSLLVSCYNATLGSPFYQEKLKPVLDVALGGTLRLFVQKVYQGSYWKDNEETSISVYLSMPNGATLDQTDFLIQRLETFLRHFKEIKQFQTNVYSLSASIDIQFTKENQFGSFPLFLKNELISKVLELGGGSWGVKGLGDGFNNNIIEGSGSNWIRLMGYNYDELYDWAEVVKDSLLQYRRIKEVNIDSRFSYFKSGYQEYVFNLKKNRLIEANINPMDLFGQLNPLLATKHSVADWVTQIGSEPILLTSSQASEYDVWRLEHFPEQVGERSLHVMDVATIEKFQAPQTIVRENQQYVLYVQYEYIGASELGDRVSTKQVKNMKQRLPLGYSIEGQKDEQKRGNSKQYWLLLIVVCIIYVTTSILFNSLKQPLAILLLIPISYIGLFLTFYIFHLNFDQGGFAAFVLLSGITVNAGIFMVNQFNQVKRARTLTPLRAYLKAWNLRIVPISLTLLSTVLGFIPFLIGEEESFWFPLAAGTIGGMVFSMVGLLVFLPAFMGLRKKALPMC